MATKVAAQSVTSLPLSPEEERHLRMVKYTLAMAIRMVCIVAMLFVTGWWLVMCAIGAILLPYFAVIVANQQEQRIRASRVAPTSTAIAPRMSVNADDWLRAPGE